MGKLGFFFKRLVSMDFHKMWQTTAFLKQRSGKSRLWLLCDMLRCAVKFNAGYMDYKIAEMYRLSDAQKRTVITRGLSNTIGAARVSARRRVPAVFSRAPTPPAPRCRSECPRRRRTTAG